MGERERDNQESLELSTLKAGIVLSFVLNQADKYRYKNKYTVLWTPHSEDNSAKTHHSISLYHAFDIAVSLGVFKVRSAIQAARVGLNKTATFPCQHFSNMLCYISFLRQKTDTCFKVKHCISN